MKMENYLKSLNPDASDHNNLVYGCKYKLFKNKKCIGVATWSKDDNVGDSFQSESVNEDGEKVTIVYIPDKWVLLN